MTRSSVVTFVCGVATGWLVVIIAAGVFILYAKSNVEHQMKLHEKEQNEIEVSRIKLPLPPLEKQDFGVFDYTWSPQTITGRPVNFEGLRDKLLVINFWTTGCSPCIKEMPEFEELSEWAKKENHPIEFFLVTPEKEEMVRQFLEHTPLALPVVSAYDELPACLWSDAFPTTLFIRPGGKICMRHIGGAVWSAPVVQDFLVGLLEEDQAGV